MSRRKSAYEIAAAYRAPEVGRPLADPLAQRIAGAFSRKILLLRRRQKISRRMLTKIIGINSKRLTLLEEGRRVPNLAEAVMLADLFGVDAYRLMREVCAEAQRGKKVGRGRK